MKFLITFFISFHLFSQDFSKIKEKTDAYPGLLTSQELATIIAADFNTNEDKLKALYSWLTKNIRYDLKEFYNPKNKTTSFSYRTIEEKNAILQAIKDKSVTKTLQSRKGVCEGYAQTFAKVCNLLTIENEIIRGYARNSHTNIGNPLQKPNHAWNAVKINGIWIYIDATWGAGHQNNGKWLREFKPYFFDMKKNRYFKTHLPEDDIWKLRVARMDKTTFYNQPIYSYRFLKKEYELVNTSSGFLKKDQNGNITVSLKNVQPNQKIHFGFLGDKFAKEAITTIKNGITTATITPPKRAKEVFFMIDVEVMLHFRIQ